MQAELYLGLAQAEDEGDRKFDEWSARLRLALDSIDARLPPDVAYDDITGPLDACCALGAASPSSSAAAPPPPSSPLAAGDGQCGDGHAAVRGSACGGGASDSPLLPAGRLPVDECAICLQAFAPRDRVKILPCGHVFHSAPCLHGWFRRSRCCPVCREPWRDWSPVGSPLVRCLLSPVNPDVMRACRTLAEAQAEHRDLNELADQLSGRTGDEQGAALPFGAMHAREQLLALKKRKLLLKDRVQTLLRRVAEARRRLRERPVSYLEPEELD